MDTTTGESGTPAAGSTAPAITGSEQTGAADSAPDTTQAEVHTTEGEQADGEVDDDAVVDDEQLAEQQPDTAEQKADDKSDAAIDAATDKKEPKPLREAREHISRLESQLATSKAVDDKVLEIGGLPVLEMAQPLVDAVLNPEAKAGDIIKALVQVAPHHDEQTLAYGIVDENREKIIEHFCGEGITPEILEKLVDGYTDGSIKLDDEEGDDDVFLTDKQKRDRETARAAEASQKAAKRAEADARTAELNTQRQQTVETIGKLLEDTVNQVLAPYAISDSDTDEVKGLKTFVNGAVHASVMRNLSADPTWLRTQQLVKGNGFRAADALSKGALAIKVARMAEEFVRQAQPFVEGTIGKAQQAAKKIEKVREEPSGATTQSDAAGGAEPDFNPKTNPNWAKDMDAYYEGKVKGIVEKDKRRDHAGRFSGTGR